VSERAQALAAALTWSGGRFLPGVVVEVGADGRIHRVAPAQEGAPAGSPAPISLPRRALLPGFINAHSHAFQRGLRGHGETYPAGAGSFWSWREAMYELVAALDGDGLYRVSLQAFHEMRAAGITTVGEFHYFHHEDADDGDYALDAVVLAAAAEVGIRVVLLNAYYANGGLDGALSGAQLRFASLSPAEYWEQMDRLGEQLAPETQSLGAVAHSVRAASLRDVVALHREARRRGLVFHIHVEEQRREVEACLAAHGKRPLALLLDALEVDAGFTAVHGTHSDPGDLARLAAAAGNLCVCPLTEANLGDGIPPLGAAGLDGLSLCLGTDSNARISMLEEARWLEYGQRLAGERRGVLRDAGGEVGGRLLDATTAGGARALGLETGEIAPGRWADFVAIDLDHPALAGADGPDALAAALVFGAPDGVVAATCVGGRWDRTP
jgi:formimidoylglutamate deiminase